MAFRRQVCPEGTDNCRRVMGASVPKRVVPYESPLTARVGPYMYLGTAVVIDR